MDVPWWLVACITGCDRTSCSCIGPENRGCRFDGRAEARAARPSRDTAIWRGDMVVVVYIVNACGRSYAVDKIWRF